MLLPLTISPEAFFNLTGPLKKCEPSVFTPTAHILCKITTKIEYPETVKTQAVGVFR
jgi:hypothetical protein